MFRNLNPLCIAAVICAATWMHAAQHAQAHFLWIIPPTSESREFALVFSEGCMPTIRRC